MKLEKWGLVAVSALLFAIGWSMRLDPRCIPIYFSGGYILSHAVWRH
jgi:hypothetical protein